MKLTRETLKRIIKEELGRVMMEIDGECPPEHKENAQKWANGLFAQLKGSEFEELVDTIGELEMGDCEIDDNSDGTVWKVGFTIPYSHADSASKGESIDLNWRSNGEHTAQEGNYTTDETHFSLPGFDWMKYALESAGYTMGGTESLPGRDISPAGGKYEYY